MHLCCMNLLNWSSWSSQMKQKSVLFKYLYNFPFSKAGEKWSDCPTDMILCVHCACRVPEPLHPQLHPPLFVQEPAAAAWWRNGGWESAGLLSNHLSGPHLHTASWGISCALTWFLEMLRLSVPSWEIHRNKLLYWYTMKVCYFVGFFVSLNRLA